MGQGSPDTWEHTERGIIGQNGDLVCDAPEPLDCTHLLCNVGRPKRLTVIDLDALPAEDLRGHKDTPTPMPFPREARTIVDAVVVLGNRWQHAREEHALRHSGDHFTSGRMAGYEQAIALLLGSTQRDVRAALMQSNGVL